MGLVGEAGFWCCMPFIQKKGQAGYKMQKQTHFQSHILLRVCETVPEGICPLVPAQLTADAVGDGGHKLPSQAKFRAKLEGELLRRVFPLRHIPLKLVDQRDIPNVDV